MRYGFFMSTITLKNVPEQIHEVLKSRAKEHRRSLNREIICSLEKMLSIGVSDAEQILGDARVVRESMGDAYLTQRELKAMKEEGRT